MSCFGVEEHLTKSKPRELRYKNTFSLLKNDRRYNDFSLRRRLLMLRIGNCFRLQCKLTYDRLSSTAKPNLIRIIALGSLKRLVLFSLNTFKTNSSSPGFRPSPGVSSVVLAVGRIVPNVTFFKKYLALSSCTSIVTRIWTTGLNLIAQGKLFA